MRRNDESWRFALAALIVLCAFGVLALAIAGGAFA